MYLDAIKSFPKSDTRLQTEKGSAFHIKTDVFKRQMWYAYEGDAAIGSGLIPLDPERVREIIRLNKDGKKPKELSEYKEEVVVKEPDYSNVVGQDSLNRFEHAFKAKKKKKKPQARREGVENQAVIAQPTNSSSQQAEGTRPPSNKRRNNRNKNRKPGNGNNPNANNENNS
jgi:hypothetical protein